jgi:BioD-like phosphotransacetylase family protein
MIKDFVEPSDNPFDSGKSIVGLGNKKPKSEEINKLKPVACPNCGELNKLDSKFCVKCRMVLSYDAYTEAIEESEVQKSRFETIIKDVEQLKRKYNRLKG